MQHFLTFPMIDFNQKLSRIVVTLYTCFLLLFQTRALSRFLAQLNIQLVSIGKAMYRFGTRL